MSTTSFGWLNLMRGLSAFLVFAGHLRTLTFIDYGETDPAALGKLFYFVTGFGHQCVVIFFVLSGFFITKSVQTALATDTWSFRNYGIDRMTRLWVVLVPALIVTFLADSIGVSLFPNCGAYGGHLAHLPDTNPTNKSTFSDFILNLFFLQEIMGPTFGTNAPLWSLSYEFWYYLTFPLLLFSFITRYKFWNRLGFFLAAIFCLWFVGLPIAAYFLIWLFGAGAYYFSNVWQQSKNLSTGPFWTSASLLAFVAVLCLIRVGKVPTFFNDFTLGITCAVFVFTISKAKIRSAFLSRVATTLSDISYTLYLVHLPLAILITTALVPTRFYWGIVGLTWYAGIAILLFFIVVFLWYAFERRTTMVKRTLKLRL
jgi:peptidoglycan/LPS O-acetylase OafA/YrhL